MQNIWDWLDVPGQVGTTQMLAVAFVMFMMAMIFLSLTVLTGGYKMSPRNLDWKLAAGSTSITLLGVCLGILVLGLMLSPGYVAITLFSEKINLGLSFFFISFVVAVITITFMLYTKRGGF